MSVVEQQIRDWLERIVIGFNLCPFAGAPYRQGLVRIAVSEATSELGLLDDLRHELELIRSLNASMLETTLLVVTGMLDDFDDYNAFLDEVDVFLRRGGWENDFQVATFHPRYRFEGTDVDDPGNFTNRSPWPILHILREASLDRALANYPNPDEIPERNIEKMNSLSPEELQKSFPWLNGNA